MEVLAYVKPKQTRPEGLTRRDEQTMLPIGRNYLGIRRTLAVMINDRCIDIAFGRRPVRTPRQGNGRGRRRRAEAPC